MNIFVKVKPKSKAEKVVEVDSSHYIIHVNEPPEKGKANDAVIKCLSNHLDIPKSRIIIISGHTSRQKLVQIL